jgi:hypothetical protein
MKIFLILFVLAVCGFFFISSLSKGDDRIFREEGQGLKTFPVTIDYSKSLDEMIHARNYDAINPLVTSAHFPVRGKGILAATVTLVRFEESLTAEEIIRRLDTMNLKPAPIEYLATLAAQHPDLQLFNNPHIYAFGSQWTDDKGDVRVPAISLFMNEFRASWLKGYMLPGNTHNTEDWFLAIPK